MKECKSCKVSKPEDDFYFRKGYRDGSCKECRKKKRREWARENKDKVAKMTKRWAQNNPERAKASYAKAKARRRDALVNTVIDLTPEDWTKTLAYFNYGCAVCGVKKDLHIDHFIPVASGNGDTSITNVIPLCAFHNVNKSDKHPIYWLRNESGANNDAIERVINYLALANVMLPQEYEDYVSDRYYGIDDEYDNAITHEYHEDLSLIDSDNFIYDDDDWYLTMLSGRRGFRNE